MTDKPEKKKTEPAPAQGSSLKENFPIKGINNIFTRLKRKLGISRI